MFLVTTIPWSYRSITLGKTGHMKEFIALTKGVIDLGYRWIYNLGATIGKVFPDLFFYPFMAHIQPHTPYFIYKFAIGCLVALLLIWGFIIRLRKEGLDVVDLYVSVYFFLYLFWTHHGARYLIPLFPFLIYYLLNGIRDIVRYNEKILVILIFLLLTLYIMGDIKEIIREHTEPLTPEQKSLLIAVDWLKKNVPRDSLILSRYPRWLHVYTNGYRGLRFLRTKNTEKQYKYIIENGIEYIIIDQNKIYLDDARDYLIPLINDYKDSFELVYVTPEKPKTWIYRVKRSER